MHLVEEEVEDERGEVEQPSRPQHPPHVSCRDEAELSSIAYGLGDIQARKGDACSSLCIIFNVCHGHCSPDRQPWKNCIENVYFRKIFLPQVRHHDDDVVNNLSPELGFMHPALFVSLQDVSEHQSKVEMVETQNAHEAIQEYSCKI